MYQKKQDMAKLLKRLVKEAEMTGRLAEQEGSRFCELRTEVAPGMGVAMIGEMSPKGTFSREYYFPYVKNPDVSSEANVPSSATRSVKLMQAFLMNTGWAYP